MANCRVLAYGHSGERTTEVSRLGSQSVEADAATWHTHARVWVKADDSGRVKVTRDEVTLHVYTFGPEYEKPANGGA